MKQILALVILLFCFCLHEKAYFSFAKVHENLTHQYQSYELNIQKNSNKEDYIVYDSNDWVHAVDVESETNKDNSFKVLIEKGITLNPNNIKEFHSITEFKTVQPITSLISGNVIESEAKRIYTYGEINCFQRRLAILREMVVNKEGVIKYITQHDFGSYMVDLNLSEGEQDIVRYKIYLTSCEETI